MNDQACGTYESALARAASRARRRSEVTYVVHAGEGEFAVASEDDLDTWWLGATPLAAFDLDGQRLD